MPIYLLGVRRGEGVGLKSCPILLACPRCLAYPSLHPTQPPHKPTTLHKYTLMRELKFSRKIHHQILELQDQKEQWIQQFHEFVLTERESGNNLMIDRR